MNLPDNIIRHYLRNVYFIAGGLCGGKTTISTHLSQKYGVALYNWDEKYTEHKAISDSLHQPEMHKHYNDWEEYFSRSPVEWAESLKQSIREHAKIAIVDLINRARDDIILVDGVIPFDILDRISVPERCVFLYATMEVIRRDNFRRAEKVDMLECIMRLKNPEQAKENVFRASELVYTQDMEHVRKSPFTYYIRDVNTDDDHIMQEIEMHFDFAKRAPVQHSN
jgi:cytidylate kinase